MLTPEKSTLYFPACSYGVILINEMYIAEYYLVNRYSIVTVRGVLMYREKIDLEKNRTNDILAIYSCRENLLGFPKRSQRKNIWKRIIYREKSKISVEIVRYLSQRRRKQIIKKDYTVYESDIIKLRDKLWDTDKFIFDAFYYEKN